MSRCVVMLPYKERGRAFSNTKIDGDGGRVDDKVPAHLLRGYHPLLKVAVVVLWIGPVAALAPPSSTSVLPVGLHLVGDSRAGNVHVVGHQRPQLDWTTCEYETNASNFYSTKLRSCYG